MHIPVQTPTAVVALSTAIAPVPNTTVTPHPVRPTNIDHFIPFPINPVTHEIFPGGPGPVIKGPLQPLQPLPTPDEAAFVPDLFAPSNTDDKFFHIGEDKVDKCIKEAIKLAGIDRFRELGLGSEDGLTDFLVKNKGQGLLDSDTNQDGNSVHGLAGRVKSEAEHDNPALDLQTEDPATCAALVKQFTTAQLLDELILTWADVKGHVKDLLPPKPPVDEDVPPPAQAIFDFLEDTLRRLRSLRPWPGKVTDDDDLNDGDKPVDKNVTVPFKRPLFGRPIPWRRPKDGKRPHSLNGKKFFGNSTIIRPSDNLNSTFYDEFLKKFGFFPFPVWRNSTRLRRPTIPLNSTVSDDLSDKFGPGRPGRIPVIFPFPLWRNSTRLRRPTIPVNSTVSDDLVKKIGVALIPTELLPANLTLLNGLFENTSISLVSTDLWRPRKSTVHGSSTLHERRVARRSLNAAESTSKPDASTPNLYESDDAGDDDVSQFVSEMSAELLVGLAEAASLTDPGILALFGGRPDRVASFFRQPDMADRLYQAIKDKSASEDGADWMNSDFLVEFLVEFVQNNVAESV